MVYCFVFWKLSDLKWSTIYFINLMYRSHNLWQTSTEDKKNAFKLKYKFDFYWYLIALNGTCFDINHLFHAQNAAWFNFIPIKLKHSPANHSKWCEKNEKKGKMEKKRKRPLKLFDFNASIRTMFLCAFTWNCRSFRKMRTEDCTRHAYLLN